MLKVLVARMVIDDPECFWQAWSRPIGVENHLIKLIKNDKKLGNYTIINAT